MADKYYLTTLNRPGSLPLTRVFKMAGLEGDLPPGFNEKAITAELDLTEDQVGKLRSTGKVWVAKKATL